MRRGESATTHGNAFLLMSEIDVAVPLGPRSYRIRIVHGDVDAFRPFLADCLSNQAAAKGCRQALLVVDPAVGRRAHALTPQFESVGITPHLVEIGGGEAAKSISHATRLWQELVDRKADRHTLVVPVGGGVVGDLAGFVAATYARGIPLLMVPTTLLAQVDSAVGGKVAVNLPHAKNIVGAFHQPIGVWIDTAFLETLPRRELACGMAEVVKYGVILDRDFFEWIEAHADDLLARQPRAITHAIARSCEIKAKVVSSDEREETGARAVLNFGHTVAHAIEAVAGYGGAFQHGEAVAAGMVAECRVAEKLGWIDASIRNRLFTVLHRLGLPTHAPGLDRAALLDAMRVDKKNRQGAIRFVLPRGLGQVEITDAPDLALIREVLDELGASPT